MVSRRKVLSDRKGSCYKQTRSDLNQLLGSKRSHILPKRSRGQQSMLFWHQSVGRILPSFQNNSIRSRYLQQALPYWKFQSPERL